MNGTTKDLLTHLNSERGGMLSRNFLYGLGFTEGSILFAESDGYLILHGLRKYDSIQITEDGKRALFKETFVEKIMAVACIKDDGTILTMPKPARHHNIINEMEFCALPNQQGFVTNLGKYVDRRTAKLIAIENNQILPGEGKYSDLFSEDLW